MTLTKYEIILEALQDQVNTGELTFETAEYLNDVAYEMYCNDIEEASIFQLDEEERQRVRKKRIMELQNKLSDSNNESELARKKRMNATARNLGDNINARELTHKKRLNNLARKISDDEVKRELQRKKKQEFDEWMKKKDERVEQIKKRKMREELASLNKRAFA